MEGHQQLLLSLRGPTLGEGERGPRLGMRNSIEMCPIRALLLFKRKKSQYRSRLDLKA